VTDTGKLMRNSRSKQLLLPLFSALVFEIDAFILQSHAAIPKKKLSSLSNGRDSWTLEEDWALTDNVPKFTVGESSLARTFWTQLGSSVPELSHRSDEELEMRYNELQASQEKKMPKAGPSPPVLRDWRVDQKGFVTAVSGEGRTLCFQAHALGRVIDDPMGRKDTRESRKLQPGGFVEAIGGRVYELGRPEKQKKRKIDSSGNPADKNQSDPRPFWQTTLQSSFSGLIGGAILAAAIGFNAGMSFNSNPPLTPSSQSTIVVTSSRMAPSVSEQRARTEAKVLQEKRFIVAISKRLAIDKESLSQLRAEEVSGSSSQVTTTEQGSSIVEQASASEKRARVEAKVLREERELGLMDERLKVDSVRLQDLWIEEAALNR